MINQFTELFESASFRKIRPGKKLFENKPTVGWHCVIVYGSFNEPETGLNFFLVRIPNRRIPWSKKIAPAINKIVRSFFTKEQLAADLKRRNTGRESLLYWDINGDIEGNDGKSIWYTQKPVVRYEWNGIELMKVERPHAP